MHWMIIGRSGGSGRYLGGCLRVGWNIRSERRRGASNSAYYQHVDHLRRLAVTATSEGASVGAWILPQYAAPLGQYVTRKRTIGHEWRAVPWLSIAAARNLGDRTTTEVLIQYESSDRYRTTYHPMSEESRALEQEYGYIPCLHAGNWKATVLDVLRGLKPDSPAGTKPTGEMYVVPPPYEHL